MRDKSWMTKSKGMAWELHDLPTDHGRLREDELQTDPAYGHTQLVA